MNPVSCYYYSASSGRSPVRDFIEKLEPGSQRKFFFVMSLLQSFGRRLPEPHAKYLGDEIFELRFTGREGAVRILYFFYHRERVVFTNGFLKKTNKTPAREKAAAVERRKVYLLALGEKG